MPGARRAQEAIWNWAGTEFNDVPLHFSVKFLQVGRHYNMGYAQLRGESFHSGLIMRRTNNVV